MRERLIETIKQRMGYKDEVLISRDELNDLAGIDPEEEEELQERIDELETEVKELETNETDAEEKQEKIEELEGKLERITKIIEE